MKGMRQWYKENTMNVELAPLYGMHAQCSRDERRKSALSSVCNRNKQPCSIEAIDCLSTTITIPGHVLLSVNTYTLDTLP